MADTKDGREDQARNAENRQRERAVLEELERSDEVEPPFPDDGMGDLEADLESLEYPVTGTELVHTIGDRTVESEEGTFAVEELVPETEAVEFDDPHAVRLRVERPTIAAAMKRIFEATEALPQGELRGSQRTAYERTLRELRALDAVDDDEGITVVTDWIVEQIRDTEQLPGSRLVRKRGAKFARSEGHEVRNDEWLGA